MAKRVVETYEREFEFSDESVIRVGDLEAIPFEDQSQVGVSTEVTTDEYSSVCPYSGLPDHAKLTISYVPGGFLVEHKALKLYLTSFRNVGILQEKAAQRICRDLGTLLKPSRLNVRMEFTSRGGLRNTVVAEWES